LLGCILFSVLLCFKHIFIVFAPVIGLFVLRSISLNSENMLSDFLIIIFASVKVVLLSFLPFIINSQLELIIYRLFPLHRGLLHSYWAPNFWALYSTIDLTLRRMFLSYPELYLNIFKSNQIPASNLCNGLTGEKSFSILPNISPFVSICFIAILHLVRAIILYYF
jgi:alpha-1,3-glucosyltransferase